MEQITKKFTAKWPRTILVESKSGVMSKIYHFFLNPSCSCGFSEAIVVQATRNARGNELIHARSLHNAPLPSRSHLSQRNIRPRANYEADLAQDIGNAIDEIKRMQHLRFCISDVSNN